MITNERETKMEKINFNKILIDHVDAISNEEMSEATGMWINEHSEKVFKDIKISITYLLEQFPDQDFDLREIIDFAMPTTRLDRATTIVETGLDERAFNLRDCESINEATEMILGDVISKCAIAIAHAIGKDAI